MRKSFDGLSGVVIDVVDHDPQSGHLFLFFNRRRSMMKALVWESSGYWVLSKRLEGGRFQVFDRASSSAPNFELSRSELAGHRSEDTGTDRFFALVHEHRGIAVEADHAAIGAAHVFLGAHDDSTMNIALFHLCTRLSFLNGNHDHVANGGKPTLRATQHFNALDALSAAIVRDVEIGLHLDH